MLLCINYGDSINILSIHTNVGILCTTMMVVVEVVASSGPMYTEGRQNASTIGRAIICICIDAWHMTKSLFIPEQERIMSINWKVYIPLSFSLNMRS